MSALTQFPKEDEARLRAIEALLRQHKTDIQRLWKRLPSTPDVQQGAPLTAANPVDPEEVFEGPLSGGMQVSGTAAGSGASSPPLTGTNLNTGRSGGGSGIGRSGGTPNVSGGTLMTGGELTGGTLQTGATAGTGVTGGHITGGTFTGQGTGGTVGTNLTGSGTPDSGINTGASGGGSGVGVSGGTGLSGSPLSGSPQSGTPLSGVCIGPMLVDSFADTNGLQLAFHVPDYDRYAEGWQGDTNEMRISGNRLVPDLPETTSLTERIVYSNTREKNVKLACTDMVLDVSGSYVGYVARYASDTDMWIVRASRADQQLQIIEVNAAVRTVRASSGIPSAQLAPRATSLIIRDRYMRFQWGNYWVSYGAASYLESQTRHGIYAASTGATTLYGGSFADYRADCLPADRSGTGLSGSRSESHLSGGGMTGGTPAGGLTGGTNTAGTLSIAVSRPNSDVTATWGTCTYANIDDPVDEGDSPDISGNSNDGLRNRANDTDDNEEAVHGMTQPIASGTIKRVSLWVYAAGDTAAVTVERRININGSWQTADSDSFSTSGEWKVSTWDGTWDAASGFYPLQIGIKPLTIAKSNSLYVYAAFAYLEYWS